MSAYINALVADQPDLTEHLLQLQDLHTKRLWHQLTVKLEACFQLSQFNQGDLPARIFQSFVLEFAHKINILKLAHFAVSTSEMIVSSSPWAAWPRSDIIFFTGTCLKIPAQS